MEECLPMTVASRITLVVKAHGTHAREHERLPETLRFSETYANVKRSGIANTNQRLGADSVNRVKTPYSRTSRCLRKGASA
jgi:hypothetical protein